MKDQCSDCFKNLGVPSRLKIYQYISENDKANVSEVTNYINLKQPTVSYHLKEMQTAGLLKRETLGKKVYYSVSQECPYDNKNCTTFNSYA